MLGISAYTGPIVSEFMIEAIKRGIPAKEIPITVEQRLHGHSKKPAVFRYGGGLCQRDLQDVAALRARRAGAIAIVAALAVSASALLALSGCAGQSRFLPAGAGRLPDRAGRIAAWSPDSRWIALPGKRGDRPGLPAGGGTGRQIKAPTILNARGLVGENGIGWSRDSRQISFRHSW